MPLMKRVQVVETGIAPEDFAETLLDEPEHPEVEASAPPQEGS